MMYDRGMARTPRTRRGRRPLPDTERKDRLVQARVDEELDEALRQAARRNRVTVSQLVRNVLEDTFRLVDGIVAGTASLGETVVRDARRLAASAKGEPPGHAPLDRVEAWQEVTLARAARCARCEGTLRKGAKAMAGLTDDPAAGRVYVCPACA
jgi:hypothetical protein